MAASTEAVEHPSGDIPQIALWVRGLFLTCLLGLLVASLSLSWWSSSLSRVHLPAADVWQHSALITEAVSGNISLHNLLIKHNQLHFIPVPKLIYALDIHFFSGSGYLTAGLSGLFTILCCLFFSSSIFEINTLERQEKIALCLLTSSWLASAIQWESFVNPANLQWSGLNAGLALIAAGWRKHPIRLTSGILLTICCGTPWWFLVVAAAALHIPRKTMLTGGGLLALAIASWETINLVWLRQLTPLPLFLLDFFTPLQPDQLLLYTSNFLADPLGSYLAWSKNLLAFITRFCMPPIDQWTSTTHGFLLVLFAFTVFLYPVKFRQISRPLAFIAIVILTTCLAAGSIRAQLPGAYTLRFANIGLLLVCVFFIASFVHYRKTRAHRIAWLTLAVIYTVSLAVASLNEASNIVHESNQRRLSQVAYALDIHDARATSETPFAPMMEVSHREIMAQKNVLAAHEKGIYHSREYRIFSDREPLPEREIRCHYGKLMIKQRKADPSAYKITGLATGPDGTRLSSALIRHDKHNIGFGIYHVPGVTLKEQITQKYLLTGFFHAYNHNKIELLAYDDHFRCQPLSIDLSSIQ